jgi:hypothetical protein
LHEPTESPLANSAHELKRRPLSLSVSDPWAGVGPGETDMGLNVTAPLPPPGPGMF